MTEPTELVYCKDRMVYVDLQRGFHRCIEENQCFSDEPCPLEGRFDQAPCEIHSKSASELTTPD